ncbi:MAG: hypothetical protein GZ089_12265 [Aromatoleum sp.]|nr:hypothetical protein [Aromatoleum sp.]
MPWRLTFCSSLVALALAVANAAHADSLAVIPPLPLPGPFAVQCNDLTQDFARLAPGEDVQTYWEGVPRSDGSGRYITDLLVNPAGVLGVTTTLPDDRELYGPYAQQSFVHTIAICAPTAADNPRPDYPLPTGRVVPHMQRTGEAPIWPDPSGRYPILLFSAGLGGSPLSNDYINALAIFASYGYVTVATFPGDARFADIRLEGFQDISYAIFHLEKFVAMQAIRPLALSAALDLVLAHPDWRDHVDTAHIGGFGASLGGESLLLLAGAQLTTTFGQSSKQVIRDPRVIAAVGYVPYFGHSVLPAFGRSNAGVDSVTVPFLGIAGTADTTAPIDVTTDGVRRLKGTRELVALAGVDHGFDVPGTGDIFTWSLEFLAGHAEDDRAARAQLSRMTRVAGGADDQVLIDYTAPSAAAAGERIVIEYYNGTLDHYFLTAEPAEAAMLDAGIVVPGWTRTGFDFKAWAEGSPQGLSACRFFGTPGRGPNSHFYTVDANECAIVKANPGWSFEGLAFQVNEPVAADCPAAAMLVTRLYNNGKGGQANHRYLTSRSAIADMQGQGWIIEGPVYCTPP